MNNQKLNETLAIIIQRHGPDIERGMLNIFMQSIPRKDRRFSPPECNCCAYARLSTCEDAGHVGFNRAFVTLATWLGIDTTSPEFIRISEEAGHVPYHMVARLTIVFIYNNPQISEEIRQSSSIAAEEARRSR